jgi:hypothetical protein
MGIETPKLRKRERKQRVREVWQQTFGDLDPADEAARADRVRELCPCEHGWSVPLWDIIFAACEDPSPIVRCEALHVIEDAAELGFPTSHGMRLLCGARKDPDPGVRRFAEEALRLLPRFRQMRKQRRGRHVTGTDGMEEGEE